jgi:hypothetical protein
LKGIGDDCVVVPLKLSSQPEAHLFRAALKAPIDTRERIEARLNTLLYLVVRILDYAKIGTSGRRVPNKLRDVKELKEAIERALRNRHFPEQGAAARGDVYDLSALRSGQGVIPLR